MTPRVLVFTLAALAAMVLVGCSRGDGQAGARSDATDARASGAVAIAFATDPNPPRMGQNVFEVEVTDDGGPVTNAAVTVDLLMPAMPQMNMPEMRNTVTLTHDSGGRYRAAGQVVMAGAWDVTVTVTRDGREIGRRTLKVTARQ